MRGLTLPSSLWRETAAPFSAGERLENGIEADVAIIGGGYTGLSAAIRALELGLEPVILEAGETAFGASGRNGGVVSTKYRVSLSDMAKDRGVEIARRMNFLGHEAMDCVEEYVRHFGIADANLIKTGNIRCAHNAQALAALTDEAKTVREIFGDASTRILDAEEVAHETGSTRFHGGALNSHAGIIHPLNYARGLARRVLEKGGRIFENSAVLRLERNAASYRIVTGHGTVTAKNVIIATNAYSDFTDATDRVRRTVIPFRSAIIATQELPLSTFDAILRNNRSYSETKRMMRWFRRSGNRVLFGGRGAFGKQDSRPAFEALETAMKQILPQLADCEITHRWSGLVAMSMDGLPQIGLLEPGIAFSLGYNGTGIAMSSLLGRYAVDLLRGEKPDLALMMRERPAAIPFFGLREPAVRTVAYWYQLLDRIGR